MPCTDLVELCTIAELKVMGYAKYRDYEEKYDEFENDVTPTAGFAAFSLNYRTSYRIISENYGYSRFGWDRGGGALSKPAVGITWDGVAV